MGDVMDSKTVNDIVYAIEKEIFRSNSQDEFCEYYGFTVEQYEEFIKGARQWQLTGLDGTVHDGQGGNG